MGRQLLLRHLSPHGFQLLTDLANHLGSPFSVSLLSAPKAPALSRMDTQGLQPLIETSLLLEALAS